MSKFIDDHKEMLGVAPMCAVLPIAPATYYAAKTRPPSMRALADQELECGDQRIDDANYQVYGVRKVWKQLHREGRPVARCTVTRLMRKLGLRGVVRGKTWKTTGPTPLPPAGRPSSTAGSRSRPPTGCGVADLTYVRTWSGRTYAAFVMDAFSRRILGWQTSTTLRTDLALDALEMALWTRREKDVTSVVHHSDRGVQYLPSATPNGWPKSASSPPSGAGWRYDNACRVHHRPVQDRNSSGSEVPEDVRRRRIRHLGMGRLVQPSPTFRTHYHVRRNWKRCSIVEKSPVTRPDSNN